jgi:hypothetical protein
LGEEIPLEDGDYDEWNELRSRDINIVGMDKSSARDTW